jgi:hypothetical protein
MAALLFAKVPQRLPQPRNQPGSHEAKDEQYRREVLANEARINGFTHIELVANPPPQLTGPFILWLHHDCSPQ